MPDPWVKPDRPDSTAPCTHALVIGTSAYTYLPAQAGDVAPNGGCETLGLGQTTTPASSAFAFACWLRDHYRSPDAPLGSIRVLLSASPAEEAANADLAACAAAVPGTANDVVKDALAEWQRDCETSRDNVGVFYASGHGIQLSRDDSIVLTSDFARPNRNVLEGAMDIGAIWRGMCSDRVPRRQYYFVDACRIKPDAFTAYETTPVGITLDEGDEAAAELVAIYFSAASRTAALGEPGKGTLFSQALLDCFSLHGVEPPDGDGNWAVSVTSLLKGLQVRVAERAAEHGEEQSAVVGGQIRDKVFHVLDRAPEVPVTISLAPPDAAPLARGKLWNGLTGQVVFDDASFSPDLHDEAVPGGNYTLRVRFPADQNQYVERDGVPVPVLPPEKRLEVPVTDG